MLIRKNMLCTVVFVLCVHGARAIERAKIDNYIVDSIYNKKSISEQTNRTLQSMLHEYRAEHHDPDFLRGWEKYAKEIVSTRFSYPAYSEQLNSTLEKYTSFETLALAKEMQGMQTQLPTLDEVTADPKLVAQWEEKLKKFQELLYAYHYRPNPVIKGKKPFTPAREPEEERLEKWLLDAQQKLVPLQQKIKALKAADKLTREIVSQEKNIETGLDTLLKSDVYEEDIQAFQNKINNLEELYKAFSNKYGTSYSRSLEFLAAIRKQFSLVKSRKLDKKPKKSEKQKESSAKDKALLEKLHELVEKFHNYRSSQKIFPFHFSQLRQQINILERDVAEGETSTQIKEDISHEKKAIEKWISQAEPLFALQNDIQKSITTLQKTEKPSETDIQTLRKKLEQYQNKLIAYKKEQTIDFPGSQALFDQIASVEREKAYQLLIHLQPEQQKIAKEKLQKQDTEKPSKSLEDIFKSRFATLDIIEKEVEEESGEEWD